MIILLAYDDNIFLIEEIRTRVKEVFEEVANYCDFEIDGCEVAEEHFHILISFSPRYSVSKVVGTIRSISCNKISKEFPKVKEKLWGGHFLGAGVLLQNSRRASRR